MHSRAQIGSLVILPGQDRFLLNPVLYILRASKLWVLPRVERLVQAPRAMPRVRIRRSQVAWTRDTRQQHL